MTKTVMVQMADLQVTADAEATLVTYGLGSCIALIVHDPVKRAAGMLHYMLPSSSVSPEKAKTRPAMFADTGIPLLFSRMRELGSEKKDWVIKVVGGAALMDTGQAFSIGKRNHTVLRKMLWKTGVLTAAEDVGGVTSRSARLHVGTGRVTIKARGEDKEL